MVMVMMALGILAVATLSIVFLSNQSLMQSRTDGLSDEALYAAQAGLNLKLAQLKDGDETDISGTMTNKVDTTYDTKVFNSGESPWNGFTVPGLDTYYILSEGTTPDGRSRKVGMLVEKSSSSYNIAALATDKITLRGGSYTRTYSSDPVGNPLTPGDENLATIGVTDAVNGRIEFDSTGNYVGWDGGTQGEAKIYAPPGASEAAVVSGATAGVNYSSFNIAATLSEPAPVEARTVGTQDVIASSLIGGGLPGGGPGGGPGGAPGGPSGPSPGVLVAGGVVSLVPQQTAGADGTMNTADDEWVVSARNVDLTGANLVILRINGVPDDKIAHFDFASLTMDTGAVLQIVNGSSKATTKIYVGGPVSILGGSILNPFQDPAKVQLEVKGGNVNISDPGSVARMVVNAPDETFLMKAGELRGSVVAKEILMDDGAALFYDKKLQNTDTGATVIKVLSYQRL